MKSLRFFFAQLGMENAAKQLSLCVKKGGSMRNLFKFLILGFVVISFITQAQAQPLLKDVKNRLPRPPKTDKDKDKDKGWYQKMKPDPQVLVEALEETLEETLGEKSQVKIPPDITDTDAFTLLATLTPNDLSLRQEQGEIDNVDIDRFSARLYFGSIGGGGGSSLVELANDNVFKFNYHWLDPNSHSAYHHELAKIFVHVVGEVAGQDQYVLEVVFYKTYSFGPPEGQVLFLKSLTPNVGEVVVPKPGGQSPEKFSLISDVFTIDCPPEDLYPETCYRIFLIYKKSLSNEFSGYIKAIRLYKKVP